MFKPMQLIPVGTVVLANDGFSKQIGKVIAHGENRWGKFHTVWIGGKEQQVDFIGDESRLGIGWKIATQDEIVNAAMGLDMSNGTPYDAETDGTYEEWLVSNNID